MRTAAAFHLGGDVDEDGRLQVCDPCGALQQRQAAYDRDQNGAPAQVKSAPVSASTGLSFSRSCMHVRRTERGTDDDDGTVPQVVTLRQRNEVCGKAGGRVVCVCAGSEGAWINLWPASRLPTRFVGHAAFTYRPSGPSSCCRVPVPRSNQHRSCQCFGCVRLGVGVGGWAAGRAGVGGWGG